MSPLPQHQRVLKFNSLDEIDIEDDDEDDSEEDEDDEVPESKD
jgi:hypothetical protein